MTLILIKLKMLLEPMRLEVKKEILNSVVKETSIYQALANTKKQKLMMENHILLEENNKKNTIKTPVLDLMMQIHIMSRIQQGLMQLAVRRGILNLDNQMTMISQDQVCTKRKAQMMVNHS